MNSTPVTGGGAGMGRDMGVEQVALDHDVLVVGRGPGPVEKSRT